MVVRVGGEELDRLLRALANQTRRDILRRTLVGEVSVSGLAEQYAMSFAAVQKHVAVLESVGLVHKTACGKERVVRAEPQQIDRARDALDQLAAIWRHRLDGLDDVLNESKE